VQAHGHVAKNYFKRTPPQRPTRTFKIAAFDTETNGLDGELLFATAYHEDMAEAACGEFRTIDEFLDWLFDPENFDEKVLQKTYWYSHNAEYDWRYLLPYFKRYKDIYKIVPVERAAGKFFELKVFHKTKLGRNGKPLKITTFRDSMALFPKSLKDFTSSFAPTYKKQDIGLSFRKFNPRLKEHRAYARNDVIGLVRALQAFDEKLFEAYSVHIKGTTASTAYAAMLRCLPDGVYYNRVSKSAEAWLRQAYYGGVVSINAGVSEPNHGVTVFDINASYPAAMRLGVPGGKPRETTEYRADLPGVYHARVTIVEGTVLPIVPYRDDVSMAWPTGTFETCLTSIEIEYCRDAFGAVFEIIEGFVFDDGICYPFADFVDKCERLRGEYAGTPTSDVVKLMQNSVYGRFGMRPEGNEVVIDFDGPPDETWCCTIDSDTGVIVPDAYYREVERDAEYMMPHWAAWITANARIALDTYTRLAGAENVLYRDTDSIHVVEGADGPLANHIDKQKYGKLKRERVLDDARYHAPKCYTFVERGKELDGVQAKYKGIPTGLLRPPDALDPDAAAKNVARLVLLADLHSGKGAEVEYHSSTSLKTYLASGEKYVTRKRRTTNVENIYGHRIKDGRFVPRHIAA
jgi:hypothetical protein